jgi:hypothetical protein
LYPKYVSERVGSKGPNKVLDIRFRYQISVPILNHDPDLLARILAVILVSRPLLSASGSLESLHVPQFMIIWAVVLFECKQRRQKCVFISLSVLSPSTSLAGPEDTRSTVPAPAFITSIGLLDLAGFYMLIAFYMQ